MIKRYLHQIGLFLVGFNAFSVVAINEDWEPPLGQPYPHRMDGTRFGITNSHMMYTNVVFTYDYSDDQAGPVAYRKTRRGEPYTHYVDPGHRSANNKDNPHGKEDSPRKTIPLHLKAGSVVYIRGTNTAHNSGPGSKLTLSADGTQDRPVFFTGFDRPSSTNLTAGTSWIDRREVILAGKNFIVQNLAFHNAQTETRNNLGGEPTYNFMVRDVYSVGNNSPRDRNVAFGFSGSSTNLFTASGWLWRAEIHNYGDRDAPAENDRSGWITGNFATNTGVMDCVIYDMGGDSVRIGADQGNIKHNQNYFIGRNRFYDNRENAIDVKQANGFIISETVMHSFEQSSSSGGTALAIHYEPNSGWILNNSISNCLQGIASTGVAAGESNAVFIGGNLIVGALGRGIYLDRGGGQFFVFNNTVHGSMDNFRTAGTVGGIDFRNNISSGILNAKTGYHLFMDNDSAPVSKSRNWLFFQPDRGAIRILWGSATYTSVQAFIFGSRTGVGSMERNPMYASAEAQDFTLQESSAAIDASAPITDILTCFEKQWGYPLLQKDLSGNSWPISAGRDLGAFEFQGQAKRR